MMTFKNVNTEEIIKSVEDYISWHKKRASTSPFSETRYKKAEEVLAIVKKEPGNQGYHADMVEAIYILYRECVEEVSGCKREADGLSFSDAFYYIYHILVEENKVENKMRNFSPDILDSYRKTPEKSMQTVLDIIMETKTDENLKDYQKKDKVNALTDILHFLMRLI